ncbi:MAG: bifunctional UDP-N-acetylglucosamine diphosphorylase/glucosamine-1-phosphate N-acetyltransferase GlmU [Hyphomicrobiales bacterium]|nr:bifunctional UDP-N-acetylglucosamine diphosphorylase/glucosamine-1-phosphate N-acetyltransferase GlmU [Hyphomicrobiales bacterium]
MNARTCLSVILAAGEGTRMKSALPKVLHPVGGLPMVAHVVRAALAAGAGDVALIVGNGAEAVGGAAKAHASGAESFVQTERRGTAHAALSAREAMARGYDDIVFLCGDAPLIAPEAIDGLRKELTGGADVAVLGFRPPDPTGYGRLIERDGVLLAIREEKDCTDEERKNGFCNSGVIAVAGACALPLLDTVGNSNAKGEFYLTDIVEIAHARGLSTHAIEGTYENALGINNRVELAAAEAMWQARKRRQMMLAGVTLIAPETVFFSWDTAIAADTVVEPNVWFGPGVTVAEGVRIHSFSHFEKAVIGAGSEIGPFARLRPGADLRKGVKVGNFCEVKKSVVEDGAKINHLSYVGDATIGAKANLGAGTITCNYDGFSKFHTEIGAGAFIGSNSSLVAPVTIGADAYVASGSVITEDVPDGGLAFGRARQSTKEGRGLELRARLAAAKKK